MKSLATIALALALAAGCAAPAQPRVATAPTPSSLERAERAYVPAAALAPPGSMDIAWTPAEPPPPPEVKARRLEAKPHFVSNKGTRGRLFVLPTTREP